MTLHDPSDPTWHAEKTGRGLWSVYVRNAHVGDCRRVKTAKGTAWTNGLRSHRFLRHAASHLATGVVTSSGWVLA